MTANPALTTRVDQLAAVMGTDIKTAMGLINTIDTEMGDLNTLSTAAKSSLVAALNEVKAQVNAIDLEAIIDDTQTDTDTTWSSTKISQTITAAIDQVVGGAPGTLNTLQELAAALQDNPGALSALQAIQAKSVRVDIDQTFTAAEKARGRANIGAAAQADLDDHVASTGNIGASDFVATYNNAKNAA
jgi:hypothetical protein